jgi:hypothetical protein
MKRIASLQGTVAIRFSPDEASPQRAVLTRDLVAFIAERYQFSLRPELPPGLQVDPVLFFQSGEVMIDDQKIPIHQLVWQLGGAVVTAKDTDVADRIVDHVSEELDSKFGFKIAATIRRRYYASAIVVEFDHGLDTRLKLFGRIKNVLEREKPPYRDYPFDIKRMAFGFPERPVQSGGMNSIDDIPNTDFLMERRAGEPESSNRYFASGPFKTAELDRIVALIEEAFRD